MKTRIILLLMLVVISTKVSFSQVSTSYFASTNGLYIGLSYNFSPKVWSEIRVNGIINRELVRPEAAFYYNFLNSERHNLYAGVGIAPVKDYYLSLPIGLKINTSTVVKNTAVHFELQPIFEGDSFDPSLNCAIGLRYSFGKRSY